MKLYRRLLIPDVHAPFHDTKAVAIAMQILRDFKPDEVVILGDFWDCYCLSDYTQDPMKTFKVLEEELVEGRELLKKIVAMSGSVTFIQGNHEFRVDRYINTFASKLGGMYSVREILGVPKSVRWIPWGPKNFHRCGKLVATHGSLCGIHPSIAMLRKYGSSVVFGHTHMIQEHHIVNVQGEDFAAYNIGWLGDLERAGEYIKNVAHWSHGLGLSWHAPGGEFWFQTVHIKNYQAVVNGKVYS